MVRRLFPAVLLLLALNSCTQSAQPSFVPAPTASPAVAARRAELDTGALAALRSRLSAALAAHLHDGNLDLTWGPGPPAVPAGPYAEAAPEVDAAALQALHAGVPAGSSTAASTAVTDAFKQLDGPRGGAYLLLADAAHPAAPGGPTSVDTPIACPTPGAGEAKPECLRRQVSDGIMAAWYARDTKMFFQVGSTSTVYRPVDAIAVGAALLVAGFQLHDDAKIEAGTQVLQHEMKNDLDDHYGLLFGLVTATAEGGHSVTDYSTHLADQAGAAEAMMEAFDYSREAQQQEFAQKLLQPLLDERFPARPAAGGFIPGFDLQSSGPPDHGPADVLAAVLTLQAARHYDRDDGGRFSHLEETAAAALLVAVASDAKSGGDAASGLPALLPEAGVAPRSGLATAIAVTVLADVLRQP